MEYKGGALTTFFIHCYAMRSHLMHGHHPLPTRDQIGERAAPLQKFVGDLLSEQEIPVESESARVGTREPRSLRTASICKECICTWSCRATGAARILVLDR
jgi:hypothetical protein